MACCSGDGKVLNNLDHKFTPTPLPSSNYFYMNNHGTGYLPLFGSAPRFELPEGLNKKILKIISE
jgi:hypothetical protein